MLSFALGAIPIRIHVSFWFTAAMLGMSNRDPVALIVWIAVVFISVLAHELGHAFMGKAFGLTPQIELYAFGGATSWPGGNGLSSGKRILISLAGPFAGLAIWGLLRAIPLEALPASAPVFYFIGGMLYVNLMWSLFNLLPVLPLDGGNVMAHTLAALTGGGGRRAAHVISILVAVGFGVYLFAQGKTNVFILVYMGLFAFQNIRALQPAGGETPPPRAKQPW